MLVGLMGHWQGVVRTPLGVDSNPDLDDPSVYVADFRQGGLGLPDRDYYLKTDERFAKARAAYADYLDEAVHAVRRRRRRRARRAGDRAGDEDRDARSGRATRRAIPSWATTRRRRPNSTALAPGFDWPTFEAQSQLQPGKIIVVRQPDYVTALAGLVKSEPLATWKLYLKARRLDGAAAVLPAGVPRRQLPVPRRRRSPA